MIAIESTNRTGRSLGVLRFFKVMSNLAANGQPERVRRRKFGIVSAVVNRGQNYEQGLTAVERYRARVFGQTQPCRNKQCSNQPESPCRNQGSPPGGKTG